MTERCIFGKEHFQREQWALENYKIAASKNQLDRFSGILRYENEWREKHLQECDQCRAAEAESK